MSRFSLSKTIPIAIFAGCIKIDIIWLIVSRLNSCEKKGENTVIRGKDSDGFHKNALQSEWESL
jgi:hypothetical protein